jgi:hypothetical protein
MAAVIKYKTSELRVGRPVLDIAFAVWRQACLEFQLINKLLK